ncbi:serine hydrolase [Schizosaccharomyces japonicus yFS275]|uniref:Serine hydrolase n=1 Tax=Schizosaccharomyces japonicus (strain yFS275 / FY16936) TaxID=402676 RepID=B6K0I7_SCHJY|nr:serine hydrolase [Schizosaccharomyces japonicus yFS275]EEB07458.1 serine hydrolase [Schizosaccharomyces japonicus yFS275]
MADLYHKEWNDVHGKPIARVLFVHGFGERIEAYPEFFERLNKFGIEAWGYDQRGFGKSMKSEKERARTGGWAKLFPDLDYQVERASQVGLPLFLWGHSMGGAIVLRYGVVGKHKDKLSGIIAQAPMLETHPDLSPNPILVKVGSWVSKVFPNIPYNTKVNELFHITRDAEVKKRLDDDPLVSDIGTLQSIGDMLNGGKTIITLAPQFELPLLICHGTDDNVTYNVSSKKFFDNAASIDKTYNSYPGYYHSLHIEKEPEVTEYIRDVAKWIIERCKPADEAAEETDA